MAGIQPGTVDESNVVSGRDCPQWNISCAATDTEACVHVCARVRMCDTCNQHVNLAAARPTCMNVKMSSCGVEIH